MSRAEATSHVSRFTAAVLCWLLAGVLTAYGAGPTAPIRHAARPVAKPAANPAARPVARPVAKPVAKPTAKPTAKPAAKPTPKPTANAAKPPVGKKTIRMVTINKREFLVLRDVATFYGMNYKVAGANIILSSKYTTLEFTMGSRELKVNKVLVYMGFAVTSAKVGPLMTKADFLITLHPILSSMSLPRRKIKIVRSDPGHGGKDVGASSANVLEKDISLQVANRLASKLKDAGYTVSMTRNTDVFIELDERAKLSQKNRADLFISLHCNAAEATSASGIEVYTATPLGMPPTRDNVVAKAACAATAVDKENTLLGYLAQRQLKGLCHGADRGSRRMRYVVLKDNAVPAMLVEMGFISNPSERAKLQQIRYQEQIARALCNSVNEFRDALKPKMPAAKPVSVQ